MRAGIAIDKWKLSIFERHLKHAGLKYEKHDMVHPNTFLLVVETEDPKSMTETVVKANLECSKVGDS